MPDYVVSGSLRRLGPHEPDSLESPPAEEWQATHRELGKPVRLEAESPHKAAMAWAEGSIAGDLRVGTTFVAHVIGKGAYRYPMIVADPSTSDPEAP